MKQAHLKEIVWTVQTRLEEQVLKPMQKLLHSSQGNSIRFFSSAPSPMEKNNLAANLEVVSTLIRALQDYELYLISEEKEVEISGPTPF